MVTNMIVNNAKKQEEEDKPYKMIKPVDIGVLKQIDEKIKKGGSLTQDDIEIINSLE